MVTDALVNNFPVTTQDIDCATKIHGPSSPNLKGKTAKKTSLPVVTDCIKAPPEILNANKKHSIGSRHDVHQQMPFLTSVSRHIKFATAENLPQHAASKIMKALKHIQLICKNGSFKVTEAFMDREFEPLKNNLLQSGIDVNTTAANKHVPGIECQNHTVKEHV